MSYQLRDDESIGEGIRRIVGEQIEGAIEASSSEKSEKCSPVHETRKHLKKARAALCLLAGEVNEERFQRENRNLRNVARLISQIRDAEVRLQTVRQLRDLSGENRSRHIRETEELLAFELDSFLAAFSDWQEEARTKLRRTHNRISAWSIQEIDDQQICRAVQRSYKSGRQALKTATRNWRAEDFHEFRKKAKQLWYHLKILRQLHPLILKELSDELETIADHLGHAHDLAFLRERLASMAGSRKRGSRVLSGLIDARQKELQRIAAALAERFYAQRPRQFARRIAEYFLEWEITKLRCSTGNVVALPDAA